MPTRHWSQSGIFGVVRHPLYASLIWMFCGAAIAYHNLAALGAALLIFLPAMVYRAKLEEAMLEALFSRVSPIRRTGWHVLSEASKEAR